MTIVADLLHQSTERLASSARLVDVAAVMVANRSAAIMVMDGPLLVGVVTERDILRAMRQHHDRQCPVGTIIDTPAPVVRPDVDIRDACRLAARRGIRHLVVVDEQGAPLGIVGEADFQRHFGPDSHGPMAAVEGLMERVFPRLPRTASLDEGLAAMDVTGASCVVVVDGQHPVGIVTEQDIVRLFLIATGTLSLDAVMTYPLVSVGPAATVAEAAALMRERRIGHLAVVDAGRQLIGLLTGHNLRRALDLDQGDEALRRIRLAEHYRHTLLDNIPFPAWLKDTDSRFLAVNRHLAAYFGEAGSDAVIGRSDNDYSPPELAAAYQANDRAVMASGETKTVVEQVTAFGRPVWHETYKAPVIGDDGRLLGTVGFARDITERKLAEEAVSVRNAALAGLLRGDSLEQALDLIAQSAECELTGSKCAILLTDEAGQQLRIGGAPSLPEAARRALDGLTLAAESGCAAQAAIRHQPAGVDDIAAATTGEADREVARVTGALTVWAEPLLGPEGGLLGALAIYRPQAGRPSEAERLRARLAAQQAVLLIGHARQDSSLLASLHTFRGIFDAINEALFVLDGEGRFIDANRAGEVLSGYSHAELLSRSYAQVAAEGLNDLAAVCQAIAATLHGQPQQFEFWVQDAHGETLLVRVHLTPGDYFGRPVVLALVADITQSRVEQQSLVIERDLATALAAGSERDALLAKMLDNALRFPEFDGAGIYWQQPGGSYRLAAERRRTVDAPVLPGGFPADSPVGIRAQGGTLVCNCEESVKHCSGCHVLAEALIPGCRCLLIVPVIVTGQPLAFLLCAGRRAPNISEATFLAAQSLAANFAEALLRLDAQQQARRLQQNLTGLFDSLQDFLFVIDLQGRILHHNRVVTDLLGYAPGALIGQPMATVYPENSPEITTDRLADLLAGKRSSGSLPMRRADGSWLPVETRVVSGFWNGQPALFGLSQDISERLQAEEKQRLAASVFEHAHEGIMITDPDGLIIEVNSTFTDLTGYSREEAIGQRSGLLKSGHHDRDFYRVMWASINEAGFWRGEIWNRKKSGEIFIELLTISAVRDRQGQISQFVGIFSDITPLKEHQQRLEHLAHFDPLTQLPNRLLLADRLHLAMAQTERSNQLLAVCYLDLDGFKPVNDQFGHAAGDRILIEVAVRLKQCVRAGDTVARLGGDEFVLLLGGLSGLHECDHAVDRVLKALAQPFVVSGHGISLSASVGVTLYPNDASDADTLLRHADQAMYIAKQGGRNRFHLFDSESDRRARVRFNQLSRVREALHAGEFVLHYQPKVDMRAGQVIGVEALIRWQHPEQGLLLPAQFLPSVEGSDVELQIGDWVIGTAMQQLAAWQAEGRNLSISVNVSGLHLQSRGFVHRLAHWLKRYPAVPAHRLEIEVIETAALDDIVRAAETFVACRQLGVSLALDDFGTGYSSLTYFRRLPVNVLKIDQSFVRDMLDDPEDLAIIEGVIGLTRAFGRKVVAEGVERIEQGAVLLVLGCDIAQGDGIAPPMPVARFVSWLKSFSPPELWNLLVSFNWSRDDLPILIAEADHHRWMLSLESYLADTTGEEASPVCDHRDCRFGHWYYSPAGQRYALTPGFADIEAEHIRLHQIGLELIALKRAGQSTELAVRLEGLRACSHQLFELVHQVEAELLLQNGS